MVAATFSDARIAAGESAEGLFPRFLKSMTDTRTQGRRDIRLQTPLLPKTQAEELPFGGW
jgi:hypothetical protein